MSVTAPTFFVSGDRIIEVAYTEWDTVESDDGQQIDYHISGGVDVNLGEGADRIIFELPHGCYQMSIPLNNGGVKIVPVDGGGPMLEECRQKAHFEDEIKQTEAIGLCVDFT